MNLNVTVNENCGGSTTSPTSGTYSVRVWYLEQPDAGHLYGVFSTRQQAEQCVLNLSFRSNVRSAMIEETP